MLSQALQIQNPKEIPLFRAMIAYFTRAYPANIISIQEKHKHIVEFNCHHPTHTPIIYQNVHKEIADLLIITFSIQHNSARATFLQAKWGAVHLSPFCFRGDVFQYLLLSQRPIFTNVGKAPQTNTILHSALFDSIGSFGIFYTNNGIIDFVFSVATKICICPSAPFTLRNNKRKLQLNNNTDVIQLNHNYNDAQTIYGANKFENELLSFHIGSPICLNTFGNLLATYNDNLEIQNIFREMRITPKYENNYTPIAKEILLCNIDNLPKT